jgi:hypothetical protein
MPHIDTVVPHVDTKAHSDTPHSDVKPHSDTPHTDAKTHDDVPKHHEDVVGKPHIDTSPR